MIDARFVHPEWIAAVAAGWCAAAALVWAGRAQRRLRRRPLGGHTRPAVSVARDLALLSALAVLGLALLGPRLGERTLRVPASGADVALLFDVSRSMAARDVAPSRMAAAQRAARELLARLGPGDRVALAIFASRASVLAPLTPDREALGELVGALDTRLIEPAGSRLAAGVAGALQVFQAGSERPRVLLLLSDGEDPERASALGIAETLRADVRVVAVAFGSDAGANVPDGGSVLRDASGAPVVTRRDARRLERLALATGGALFVAGPDGHLDFGPIETALRAGSASAQDAWVERRVPAVRVLPLAALAACLLVLEAFARRRASARASPVWLALLACALLAATPPESGDEIARLESALRATPGDARLLVALGVARLEAGDGEAGERALLEAAASADEPALAALARYDLGVAALAAGELERAREAFLAALALDPDDRQARFNYEWTQSALRSAPAPEPSAPPPPRPAPPADPARTNDALEASEPLDAATQRRLLLRVEDDLRRALLSAAQADAPRRPPRRPAW